MAVFRCGQATDADWESAARRCLLQMETGSHRGDLGFIYVTDPLVPDLPEVVEFLRVRTGVADWVGSVGAGVCGPGVEHHEGPAMSVAVAALPAGSFRVFSGVQAGLDAFERDHGEWCRSMRPTFGIVHADPRVPRIAQLVEGLSDRMGGGFLVGGLSSAASEPVQVANGVTSGGLSGVMLDSRVVVATRLTQGCKPIGGRYLITACDGNVVYKLDGQPATDVLFGNTGDILARRPGMLGGYIYVGIPVRGSDTGDYLVRHIVALDRETGAVAIDTPLEVGDSLMFCRRDGEAAEEDLRRMSAEARRGLGAEPRGALYFSCVARGPNLFGAPGAELRMLEGEIGHVPLAGFFGDGEISSSRLYGYTGVLALFA